MSLKTGCFFEEECEIYNHAVLYDKPDKVKAYILLNLAGPEAIRRAKNFTHDPAVMSKNGTTVITPSQSKGCLADLLLKFKELCNPQNNVFMERHIFFTRDQKHGESVEAYITDLKEKAKTCEFLQLQDSLNAIDVYRE